MQTGQRWAGKANPRDLTATRQRQLLAEHAAREAAANEIDLAAIKLRAFELGHAVGWDAAIAWVIAKMTDVGVDPDILVVAGDDEPAGDE